MLKQFAIFEHKSVRKVSVPVIDPDVHRLAVAIEVKPLITVIDQYREIIAAMSGRSKAMTMEVAAQHKVDAGTVQYRKKYIVKLFLSIP